MSYFPAIGQFALYSLSMSRNRFMAPVKGQEAVSEQGVISGQEAALLQGGTRGQAGVQRSGEKQILGEKQSPGEILKTGEGQAEEAFAGNFRVSKKGDFDTYECQTCKNRKYQDGSNDPGVSFKTPTVISPERAAFAIRSHEAEHVARARLKALEEDKEIVSQSVSYRTGICPECGRVFMAGGNTRTVMRSVPETYSQEGVKKGVYLDLTA